MMGPVLKDGKSCPVYQLRDRHFNDKSSNFLQETHKFGCEVVVSSVLEFKFPMNEHVSQRGRSHVHQHVPLWENGYIITFFGGFPIGPGVVVTPTTKSERKEREGKRGREQGGEEREGGREGGGEGGREQGEGEREEGEGGREEGREGGGEGGREQERGMGDASYIHIYTCMHVHTHTHTHSHSHSLTLTLTHTPHCTPLTPYLQHQV